MDSNLYITRIALLYHNIYNNWMIYFLLINDHRSCHLADE